MCSYVQSQANIYFAVQILHLTIFAICYIVLIDQVQLLSLSLLTINVKLILTTKLPEG